MDNIVLCDALGRLPNSIIKRVDVRQKARLSNFTFQMWRSLTSHICTAGITSLWSSAQECNPVPKKAPDRGTYLGNFHHSKPDSRDDQFGKGLCRLGGLQNPSEALAFAGFPLTEPASKWELPPFSELVDRVTADFNPTT